EANPFQYYIAIRQYGLGAINKVKNKHLLFRSYFWPQKYTQNPSLKIFALTACAHAFYLLSANIYQATFSVRKGFCLKLFLAESYPFAVLQNVAQRSEESPC